MDVNNISNGELGEIVEMFNDYQIPHPTSEGFIDYNSLEFDAIKEEVARRLLVMDEMQNELNLLWGLMGGMIIKPEVDIDFTDNGSGTTLWYVKLNDYLLGDGSPNKGDIKMEAIRIAHALGVIPLFHLPDALIKEVDKV